MICIIQARSNSKRFKKKVLKRIYGITLVEWVYKRSLSSKNIKKTIIATSISKKDDKLVYLLKKKKIPFFRGSLNDVSSRYLKICKQNKIDYCLRISGDSPLIDPNVIDKVVDYFQKNLKSRPDLVTNIFPRSLPSGQSVEILNVKSLTNSIKNFTELDKEHVTRYFYRKFNKFKILNLSFNSKQSFKMSIDTKKDLDLIKKKIKKKQFNNFKIL